MGIHMYITISVISSYNIHTCTVLYYLSVSLKFEPKVTCTYAFQKQNRNLQLTSVKCLLGVAESV